MGFKFLRPQLPTTGANNNNNNKQTNKQTTYVLFLLQRVTLPAAFLSLPSDTYTFCQTDSYAMLRVILTTCILRLITYWAIGAVPKFC